MVEVAKEEALKSDYKMKLGCVIFDKNKIISKGHNYKQRSVKSLTKKFLHWEYSIHAEVDAIIKAKTDLKGMSLLVIRINNKGELMYAKPCKHCSMYIEHVGIKKVMYSIKGGVK
jgi:deoxycytidylate deaminase